MIQKGGNPLGKYYTKNLKDYEQNFSLIIKTLVKFWSFKLSAGTQTLSISKAITSKVLKYKTSFYFIYSY